MEKDSKRKSTAKKTAPKVEAPEAPLLKKIEIPKGPSKENGVVVLVTGGFDPLHSGHLDYIDAAKKLGDNDSWFGSTVVVGVNSDEWLTRKKGKPFMSVEERVRLLMALSNVDQVITFDDSDDSAMNAIHMTRSMYPDQHIIFANGGDRTSKNIKESGIQDPNLSYAFNVGGNKSQSSSSLLGTWTESRTDRDWGYYRVLHEVGREVKVKELTVEPGKSLSMQRHQGRSEFWFIAEGIATVYTVAYPNDPKRDVGDILLGKFHKLKSTFIPANEWHRLVNNESFPLKVIEIQFGDNCTEDDIERVFRSKKG